MTHIGVKLHQFRSVVFSAWYVR